jgi:antitoxin component of MazEF toxin-antitoxin module
VASLIGPHLTDATEETQEMSETKHAPVEKPRLKELVARITTENRHLEVDWGEPVGKEEW